MNVRDALRSLCGQEAKDAQDAYAAGDARRGREHEQRLREVQDALRDTRQEPDDTGSWLRW